MRLVTLLALLLLSNTVWAAPIYVSMLNVGAVQPQPNFFLFDVDGVVKTLICDQFFPNVTSERYTAKVATLDDLSDTALIRQGDSLATALQKYTWVAMLDTLAYANPTLAPDVTRANRFIVDGSGALTTQASNLLAQVQASNPATFNLTGFKIYVPIRQDGVLFPTQEQTGFDTIVPEPASALLIMAGAGVIALLRKRS